MAKTDTAVEAVKKAPMTAAERKRAQREREQGNNKNATTWRKQLNVTVSLSTTFDLEKLVKETGLTQGEIVSRLISAAAFQVEWLRQPVDGLDIPSDAPSSTMIDTWQSRSYYSNHKKPTKVKDQRDLRKMKQEESYLREISEK